MLSRLHLLCKYSTTVKKNPYRVLGLTKQATQDEIKAAYYALAKKYHPDHDPSSAETFKDITDAYKTLRNETQREQFEQLHKKAPEAQTVEKAYYHTNYHYGYTNKHRRDTERMFYSSNPFGEGGQTKWSNEYTREMFEEENKKVRQGTLKQMNSQVRMGLLAFLGLVGMVLAAQGFIWLYEWNHAKEGLLKSTTAHTNQSKMI